MNPASIEEAELAPYASASCARTRHNVLLGTQSAELRDGDRVGLRKGDIVYIVQVHGKVDTAVRQAKRISRRARLEEVRDVLLGCGIAAALAKACPRRSRDGMLLLDEASFDQRDRPEGLERVVAEELATELVLEVRDGEGRSSGPFGCASVVPSGCRRRIFEGSS